MSQDFYLFFWWHFHVTLEEKKKTEKIIRKIKGKLNILF